MFRQPPANVLAFARPAGLDDVTDAYPQCLARFHIVVLVQIRIG